MAYGELQNGIVHEAHRAADADQPATYEYSPKPTLARQAILELEQSPSQKVF
jgi:hypothetical protein